MSMHAFRSLIATAALCLLAPLSLGQHADHQGAAHGQAEKVIPYTADHCPISGKELGSMGDPVVREYDGREVRFCCSGCIRKFESDTEAGFERLDEILIKAQMPYYPVSTCLVSGEPLFEDGEDIGVNVIHEGRLVRFCCKSCARDFRKDPEPIMKKLDAAVMAHQRAAYPLDTCPVSGEELGGMGDPYELVVGDRLVRLCCSSCEKKLLAHPMHYLAALDKAWEARGLPDALTEAPEAMHHEVQHAGDTTHEDHGHSEHGNHGG